MRCVLDHLDYLTGYTGMYGVGENCPLWGLKAQTCLI